jgi:hypothetical protein
MYVGRPQQQQKEQMSRGVLVLSVEKSEKIEIRILNETSDWRQ